MPSHSQGLETTQAGAGLGPSPSCCQHRATRAGADPAVQAGLRGSTPTPEQGRELLGLSPSRHWTLTHDLCTEHALAVIQTCREKRFTPWHKNPHPEFKAAWFAKSNCMLRYFSSLISFGTTGWGFFFPLGWFRGRGWAFFPWFSLLGIRCFFFN